MQLAKEFIKEQEKELGELLNEAGEEVQKRLAGTAVITEVAPRRFLETRVPDVSPSRDESQANARRLRQARVNLARQLAKQ